MAATPNWMLTMGVMAVFGGTVLQTQDRYMPRGQPTVVDAAEVQKVVATLGSARNIDKVVRTVDTHGPAGLVSIAAVAYRPGPQNWDGTANEHRDITEVFHVTRGSATFVFGGNLDSAKEFDAKSEAVRKVFGPGRGGKVSGHRRVTARAGDNVILPPNSPHQIVEVTEDFEMIVIRIDPARVLQIN